MRTRNIVIVLLVLLCLIAGIFASVILIRNRTPVTIRVPDDYGSIQAAIDAARPIDTIIINPGTYNETLKIERAINMFGQSPDTNAVIIESASSLPLIDINNCPSGKISNLSLCHLRGDPNSHPDIIHISNSSIDISKCEIRNAKGNGILAELASQLDVSHCTIEKSYWSGIAIKNKNSHAVLKSNHIADNNHYGICVYDGASCAAQHNDCISNKYAGIKVDNSKQKSEIFANNLLRNTYDGIDGSGSLINITQNICSNNRNGVNLIACDFNSFISENQCRSNSMSGIVLQKTNGTEILANNCTQNGLDGIRAIDGSTSVNVLANRCVSNDADGIFIWKSTANVSKNYCADNNQIGISVSQSPGGADISENITEWNFESGINSWKSSNVSIKRNVVRHNRENGILINRSNGIDVDDNSCDSNLWQGICAHRSLRFTLSNNKCRGNYAAGIYFEDARGNAKNNICRFNHINGMAVKGKKSSALMTNNTCSDNYPSGILFEEAGNGKAIGNICQNNPFSGIAIRGDGANPVIADNNLSNNGTWGIRAWANARPQIDPNNLLADNAKGPSKLD